MYQNGHVQNTSNKGRFSLTSEKFIPEYFGTVAGISSNGSIGSSTESIRDRVALFRHLETHITRKNMHITTGRKLYESRWNMSLVLFLSASIDKSRSLASDTLNGETKYESKSNFRAVQVY
jgi:hypothetical protein